MTVSELIAELQKLDPAAEVYVSENYKGDVTDQVRVKFDRGSVFVGDYTLSDAEKAAEVMVP